MTKTAEEPVQVLPGLYMNVPAEDKKNMTKSVAKTAVTVAAGLLFDECDVFDGDEDVEGFGENEVEFEEDDEAGAVEITVEYQEQVKSPPQQKTTASRAVQPVRSSQVQQNPNQHSHAAPVLVVASPAAAQAKGSVTQSGGKTIFVPGSKVVVTAPGPYCGKRAVVDRVLEADLYGFESDKVRGTIEESNPPTVLELKPQEIADIGNDSRVTNSLVLPSSPAERAVTQTSKDSFKSTTASGSSNKPTTTPAVNPVTGVSVTGINGDGAVEAEAEREAVVTKKRSYDDCWYFLEETEILAAHSMETLTEVRGPYPSRVIKQFYMSRRIDDDTKVRAADENTEKVRFKEEMDRNLFKAIRQTQSIFDTLNFSSIFSQPICEEDEAANSDGEPDCEPNSPHEMHKKSAVASTNAEVADSGVDDEITNSSVSGSVSISVAGADGKKKPKGMKKKKKKIVKKKVKAVKSHSKTATSGSGQTADGEKGDASNEEDDGVVSC